MTGAFKLETYDVKDRVVVISDADLTDEVMGEIASKLKKFGAHEVIFSFGVELKTLSDEDLKNVGLCRITQKPPLSAAKRKKK